MTYYVTQFGNHFFSIRRVKGYSGKMIFKGTQISAEEYNKLFYSSPEREVIKSNSNFDEVRIKGIASEILKRELNTVRG